VLRSDDPLALPRPSDGKGLRKDLLTMLGAPEQADPAWVTSQYDWYVRGNTVLAMREDGGVLRVDEGSQLGIALATDGNGRYCQLDPYQGARLALSEAYRNVAMTGARPLAVTNCLNFGSPEDPGVMWQFSQTVTGLADGCAELGTPVTGGNVSFYNQTDDVPIYPTPVVGVLGVLPDVRRRVPSGFVRPQASVVLLGETTLEIGGSAWAYLVHRHLGGRPPVPDLDAEARLAALVAGAAESGLLDSAHDLSDGGLAVALAESCLRGRHGCRVTLPGDPFEYLFSESVARAVVSTSRADELMSLAAVHEVPAAVIGFTGGDALEVTGLFEIGLGELASVNERTLPAALG
jgi:phosphoribosylformylglycinamidine synthase